MLDIGMTYFGSNLLISFICVAERPARLMSCRSCHCVQVGRLLEPYQIKKPNTRLGFFICKESDDDLLSHGQSTLSLARSRFTVLFGMGRSGTNSLWSSDKLVSCLRCSANHCVCCSQRRLLHRLCKLLFWKK